MIEAILPILQEIAKNVIGKLFESTVGKNLKNTLAGLRADNAKRRSILRLLESLQPLFRAELSLEEATVLAQTLELQLRNVRFTPELIARHRYDVDKLVTYCLADSSSRSALDSKLQPLLYDMTKQVCLVTIAMSNILPEWERISWQENFRAFEEIQDKLTQQSDLLVRIYDEPTRKTASFEAGYRQYIAYELRKVYLKGIGNIGDTKSLSLETLFIHAQLRQLASEDQLRGSQSTSGIKATANYGTPKVHKEHVDILTAITKSRLLVIQGFPGAGKSTVAQFLALTSTLKSLAVFNAEKLLELVPFLFKVRALEDFDQLPRPKNFISICAPILDTSEGESFVLTVLQEKRAMLILDGLDECEIARPKLSGTTIDGLSQRDKLIAWIQQIVRAFPGNLIVVTSRPVGYMAGELTDLGFFEYEIMPLSEPQQEHFVNHWCRSWELSILPEDSVTAYERAEQVARDLIQRIKSTKSVQALAHNPLMLCVICILHRYKGERLPERKVDLLNDCLNVLLYDWCNAHGLKHSVIGDLDARKLRCLLEPLAWQMSINGDQQISDEDLQSIFAQYLPEIDEPVARALDIISIIRDRTGVLLEISPRTYAFTHLLFQEYLAAQECARRRDKYDQLLANASDPRWREIIPMAVAASKGNEEMLIRGLLHADAITLAASAVGMLDRVTVELRAELLSKLNDVPRRMQSEFDSKLLASLVQVGTAESAQVLIRLLLEFPVISASEFINFAAKFEFESKAITFVSKFAEDTLARCLLCRELDLGVSYGSIRSLGYYNEEATEYRGLSWDCLMVGISIGDEDTHTQQSNDAFEPLGATPIYNYAVILNMCDAQRAHLSLSIWPAFEAAVRDKLIAPEKALLALHLTWYLSSADENISSLLEYLSLFPRKICPAFQIGLLNNAMSCLSPSVARRMRPQAEELWRSCFTEIHNQITSFLFEPWQQDSPFKLGTAENPIDASSTETAKFFNETLEAQLVSAVPFSFMSDE